MNDKTAQKTKLRAEARQRRAIFHASTHLSVPLAMAAHFLGALELSPDDVIALYAPGAEEADCSVLGRELAQRGHRLCLPVIESEALKFNAWVPGDALLKGRFSIGVPGDARGEAHPNILVVPLLAFDASGHRLGFGGGYYDRTLQSLRSQRRIIAVGYAYSIQEVAKLPSEAHDELLDWVVTEKEARRFTAGRI